MNSLDFSQAAPLSNASMETASNWKGWIKNELKSLARAHAFNLVVTKIRGGNLKDASLLTSVLMRTTNIAVDKIAVWGRQLVTHLMDSTGPFRAPASFQKAVRSTIAAAKTGLEKIDGVFSGCFGIRSESEIKEAFPDNVAFYLGAVSAMEVARHAFIQLVQKSIPAELKILARLFLLDRAGYALITPKGYALFKLKWIPINLINELNMIYIGRELVKIPEGRRVLQMEGLSDAQRQLAFLKILLKN